MPIAVADAVQRLVTNRSAREISPPLSETAPDLTLDEGYAIQRSLERALCASGDRVVGWKAGFTNATLQESYGASRCWASSWARAPFTVGMTYRCRAS